MHYTRTLLSLLAVSLLSLAAATPAAASDASLPAPPRTLVFLNWSEYIDPELVEEFEQQFNAKVSEVYFESDDLRDDMMLETGAIGYDLVIVNGINVDSYRKRGWIAPLDQAALPNLKHVDQHWRNAFDSGNGYGVPYFWGTLGIAYRQDLVEQAPGSWMDILRPPESLHGKIGMVENARDLLGMALKALGHSANSTDPSAIKAAEQLLPLVYDELRKLAAAKLAHEKPGQTLQATALVHEAYLRLVDVEKAQQWDSRGHFYAAAAEAMRRILVEAARRRSGPRRGGGLRRLDADALDQSGAL